MGPCTARARKVHGDGLYFQTTAVAGHVEAPAARPHRRSTGCPARLGRWIQHAGRQALHLIRCGQAVTSLVGGIEHVVAEITGEVEPSSITGLVEGCLLTVAEGPQPRSPHVRSSALEIRCWWQSSSPLHRAPACLCWPLQVFSRAR